MLVTRVEKLRTVAPSGNGRVRVFAFSVEATVDGPVDSASGMVVNLADMKTEIRRLVVQPLEGLVLDGENGRPEARTPEQLAVLVRDRLAEGIGGCGLRRVRLVEPATLVVDFPTGNGEEMDVTRIYEFSASHRLHSAALSDDENRRIFGKCNNPAGHGHNYVLEVTVRGTAPEGSGELLTAGAFDRIVEEQIVDRWDHRNLNEDLEDFAGVNPTAEEIARVAWGRLEAPLNEAAPPARLHRVKLRETDRNHVEYFGPEAEAS